VNQEIQRAKFFAHRIEGSIYLCLVSYVHRHKQVATNRLGERLNTLQESFPLIRESQLRPS
jgi:hypothetical protein